MTFETMDIRCRKCGAENKIFGTDIPAYEEVCCSGCGRPLGCWTDLAREAAAPEGFADRPARPAPL